MALGGNIGGAAIGAAAIKAGEAFFEITGSDEKFKKILKDNFGRLQLFASKVQKIGLVSAGLGAAIFAPLAAVFRSSLDRAADTGKLAERLGTTTESLSSLGYAAEASGVQVEDWVKAAEKMQQAALQAAKGGTDQAASLELLGTNAQDFANMKLEDKFLLVAKAVEGIKNPLEKQMLLAGLFGDEFGKLLPLFSKGRDGIKALMAEAGQVGAVINSDDARAAIDINKDLNKVWASAKNTVFELGLAVLNLGGNIKDGTSFAMIYLTMIREFIRNNRQLIATIALVAGGLAIGGTAFIAIAFAIKGVIAIIGGLIAIGSSLIAGLFTPLGAAVAALAVAFAANWSSIRDGFMEAWDGIVGALQKGDLALAGEIAMAGLEVAWKLGLSKLTEAWVAFKRFIIDQWMSLQSLFEEAVAGIQTTFIWATEGRKAAEDFAEGVGQQLRKMKEAEKADREAFRQQQIEEAKGNLADARERLRQLAEKGKAQKPEVKVDPKEEEALRRKLAISLGDSVKGTFHSADFTGALARGKANEYAKKQYEVQKQQLAVLNDINKKVGQPAFQ